MCVLFLSLPRIANTILLGTTVTAVRRVTMATQSAELVGHAPAHTSPTSEYYLDNLRMLCFCPTVMSFHWHSIAIINMWVFLFFIVLLLTAVKSLVEDSSVPANQVTQAKDVRGVYPTKRKSL